MSRTAHAATALILGVAADQIRRSHQRGVRRRAATVVRADAVEAAVASALPTPPGVCVVMAALNEGPSIGGVLAGLPTTLEGLPVSVVVVDDGSTDETGIIASKHGALVARHRHNLGQGDGLRTGFAVALELGARVVVTMDADGQHDPEEMGALVKPVVIGDADYVQGSRFLGRYDDAGGARQAGIRGFTWLINALAGTEMTDCTNGYRAIRCSGLARMRLVEDRFSAAEILIEASAAGLRMLEMPVHIRSRDAGESKKPRGLGYPLGYLGTIIRCSSRRAVTLMVRRFGVVGALVTVLSPGPRRDVVSGRLT